MSKGHTLQDPFLNVLRKERIPVSIYLVSGIKLQGACVVVMLLVLRGQAEVSPSAHALRARSDGSCCETLMSH